jgi:hypothetical protein
LMDRKSRSIAARSREKIDFMLIIRASRHFYSPQNWFHALPHPQSAISLTYSYVEGEPQSDFVRF